MRKYLIAIITFVTVIMLSSCTTSGYINNNVTASGRYVSDEEVEAMKEVGTVQVDFKLAHWFFTGSTETAVEHRILKEASKRFGSNVVVKNINYSGEWSALSLLMYYNTLGYVENVFAYADVYKKQ